MSTIVDVLGFGVSVSFDNRVQVPMIGSKDVPMRANRKVVLARLPRAATRNMH